MSAIVQLENGITTFRRGDKTFQLEFISPTAIRFYEAGRKESYAIAKAPSPAQEVRRGEEEGENALFYGDLSVHIHKSGLLSVRYKNIPVFREKPYQAKNSESDILAEKEGHLAKDKDVYSAGFAIENNRPVYGSGDKAGPLDKRGYDFINWNSDYPIPHNEAFKSLYKSIPFFLMFGEACSVGVFVDNTFKTRFDFNKQDKDGIVVESCGGVLDVYLFFGSLPNVIAEYTRLVGGSALPPRWALGAQQSRWSYGDAQEVEEVIAKYKESDIPLSAVYLDIAYMDEFKDFTVDEKRFPNVSSWLKKVNQEGIHIVPIIDAGVKAETVYPVYEEGLSINAFCKDNGEVYHNEVWPGDSVFPAFNSSYTRLWWSERVADFLDLGFSGIWNDMNEPASFNGPIPNSVDMGGKTHAEIHNVYGHLMSEATYLGFLKAGKRPYVITRAAYAGTAKFAGTWTGDNFSSYDHIRMMLPQLCGLSLSGYSYAGVDIGGFSGDATSELLVRFAQASLFNPFFRNHSACDTRSQEPYAFDEETIRRYRDVVLTRYELIPYLYDLLFLHQKTGIAVIRPLVYNFPKDPNVVNENTEIMLGDNLLLAPALFPGQTKRSVYFPCGFINYFNGMRYGPGYHLIDCGLDEIPLFVKEGSLTPLANKGTHDTDFGKELRLLWTGGKAFAYHYEDEGDGLGYLNGEYNLYLFEIDEEGHLTITTLNEGMVGKYEKITVDHLGNDLE